MVSMKKYGLLIDLYRFLPAKSSVFQNDSKRIQNEDSFAG